MSPDEDVYGKCILHRERSQFSTFQRPLFAPPQYGLTLLLGALNGGLAGHGRADPREAWGETVNLQIIDPRAFAGLDAFTRQLGTVADQCNASRPVNPSVPVVWG